MNKKDLRAYQIDIYGLSTGVHDYQFEVTKDLFHLFEQEIVTSGSGVCHVSLDKSATMLTLEFNIQAKVELICDLSVRPFDHEIQSRRELRMKFGDTEDELSDEIVIIPWDSKWINVAEYIYQFVLLEIPMKKIHPDLRTQERPDVLYRTQEEEIEEEETIDPRWEALKKLKD